MKKIVESYRKKLGSEDGWVLKRGSQLRIALCYPNVYSIGMANLGFQAMYALFNNIPVVSCERVCLLGGEPCMTPTVREGVSRGKRARAGKGSGYDHALPHGRATAP